MSRAGVAVLNVAGSSVAGSNLSESNVSRQGGGTLSVVDGAKRIAAGQLLAFPTETVYGLGANACDDAAVAKIFAAKGRPADHPLIVHVFDPAAALAFAAEIPDFAQRLIDAFWPGPLTVILPRKAGVAAASAGGQDSIGLRCPAHAVARELLAECAQLGVHGISAPSANKFGKVSPTTAAHVMAEFGNEIPVLDGGACSVGIESTIVDCTRGVPVLLRPGVLTTAQIEAAMGRPLLTEALLNSEQSAQEIRRPSAENTFKTDTQLGLHKAVPQEPDGSASHDVDPSEPHEINGSPLRDTQSSAPLDAQRSAPREAQRPAPREAQRPAPRASGTLASHYAPQAPLRLMDAKALQTALDLLGSEAKNIAIYARAPLKILSSHITLRRMPSDALATAQQLFAVLREFDAQNARLIWVETVPPDAAWDGVRDRLQRAAA